MSETIQVALITFASGALGTIVGAVSSYSEESAKAFVTAANRACLVASPAAVVEICLFRECTLNGTENRMSAVVAAMQKDLSVFTEPDIRKNHWNDK